MNWPAQCAAVIPCLNEARTIEPLVRAVISHLPTVFVVDDGSTDLTASLATQAGARVLRHPTSRGKGAALRTGWLKARESGFGWALSLDGDGQHDPQEIPGFFRCAEMDAADLIIGNRMTSAQAMPWLRRCVNRWVSRRLSSAAGRELPDSQCGFRLMNLHAWSALPINATHFEIESEVLLAFLRAGRRVEFVPIRAIYAGGKSKIHPLRDTVRWLRWWVRARRRET